MSTIEHIPVLLEPAVELLRVRPGGTYADCTVGLGGHSAKILEELAGDGRLIGLDRDEQALEIAGQALLPSFSNLQLFNENFKNLSLVCKRLGIDALDGCLLDLGVSSLQLDSPERGFSIKHEARLDMRMDRRTTLSAADLLNHLPEERLVQIFREYGEEKNSRRIAAEIVRRRQAHEIRSTGELARLVESIKGRPRKGSIHPATQVFQALRIEVNQELAGLGQFLEETVSLLRPGGRLVVIAFHSLEDRIVKQVFRSLAGQCVCFRPQPVCRCPRLRRVQVLTRRPIIPSAEELRKNPRARSARLRAIEKNTENAREGSEAPGAGHPLT